jgi:hypothetical protein
MTKETCLLFSLISQSTQMPPLAAKTAGNLCILPPLFFNPLNKIKSVRERPRKYVVIVLLRGYPLRIKSGIFLEKWAEHFSKLKLIKSQN